LTAEGRARRLELFADLAELEPEGREARLAALRREDPDLAVEVERLLAADAADGPLDRMRDEVAQTIERQIQSYEDSSAPRVLGAWTLTERIGVGGMGEVWKAERTDGGFAQVAALKLVRLGMASEGVVARFLLERQVLARLTHPAIARLYDGGVAPDGRPWFAMEYVDGRPITEFARGLSIERILQLFLEVAEAVDFAHRNLVVHRDLKPSNLLVTAAGEPKLLDFGLAKMLEPDFDPGLTRTELRVLTPAYAAPEQILGEPITTATDVYTLGVLLYQLLTGRLPHRREVRTDAALYDEVSRETVERPSAAVRRDVGDLKKDLRLSRRLAGDLDTIVLQALRREPARRYPSAAAFAEDIRRFLDGRPVAARADTLSYRASKFLRRHYVGVGATALVLVALVTGLVGTAWQARRAQRQAQRAEQVQAFLIGLFEGSDPDRSRGATITARELLTEGTRQLDASTAMAPEARAALLDAVAHIEDRLGLFEPAERHARSALALRQALLGVDALDTARTRLTLAEVLLSRGEGSAAATEIDAAMPIIERLTSTDSDDVVRALNGRIGVAMALGDDKTGVAVAERVLERQLRLRGEDSEEAASARYELGQMFEATDRFDEALKLYQQSLPALERTLGPGHARTEIARMALAELSGYRGDRPRAVELFGQSIDNLIRTRGAQHILVAHARVKLALVLINESRFEEADRAALQALETFEAAGHFDAASCLRMLGNSLFSQGRYAEAAERYQGAFERFARQLGPRHQLTFVAQANLGGAQVRGGDLAKGSAVLEQAIAGLVEVGGAESDSLRQPLQLLGEAQRRLGNPGPALATHRRQLAIAEKTVGPEHIGASNAHREIALDLEALGGHLAEARREIERAIQIRAADNPNQVRVADWLLEAARMARTAGDREAARAANERAAAIRAALAAGAS
jgi:serine/threonine-protein kinase